MNLELYPRTKERLAQIVNEFAAIKNGDLAKFFRAKRLPVPFEPAAWDRYISSISGHPPCEICGDVVTPQALRKGLVCRLFPIHARIIEHSGMYMMISRKSFEEVVRITLGPICVHKRYTIECPECFEIMKQAHIENECSF